MKSLYSGTLQGQLIVRTKDKASFLLIPFDPSIVRVLFLFEVRFSFNLEGKSFDERF